MLLFGVFCGCVPIDKQRAFLFVADLADGYDLFCDQLIQSAFQIFFFCIPVRVAYACKQLAFGVSWLESAPLTA